MKLEEKIIKLVQAIGTDVGGVGSNIGDLEQLPTENKESIVNALIELFDKIGDLDDLDTSDKSSIVSAINQIFNAGADNVKTFTPWTPAITATQGIDLITPIDMAGNGLTATLTGSTVSVTGNTEVMVNGLVSAAGVLSTTQANNLYFKMGASEGVEAFYSIYVGFADGSGMSTIDNFISSSVITITSSYDTTIRVNNLGNQLTGDYTYDDPALEITASSSDSEFCLSYMPVGGENGFGYVTLYVEGEQVAQHDFTQAVDVDRVVVGTNAGWEEANPSNSAWVECLNNPAHLIAGLPPLIIGEGGSAIDETQYPQNNQGKGYEIVGLDEPTQWDELGKEVKNGDFIVFDNDGLPQIINTGVTTIKGTWEPSVTGTPALTKMQKADAVFMGMHDESIDKVVFTDNSISTSENGEGGMAIASTPFDISRSTEDRFAVYMKYEGTETPEHIYYGFYSGLATVLNEDGMDMPISFSPPVLYEPGVGLAKEGESGTEILYADWDPHEDSVAHVMDFNEGVVEVWTNRNVGTPEIVQPFAEIEQSLDDNFGAVVTINKQLVTRAALNTYFPVEDGEDWRLAKSGKMSAAKTFDISPSAVDVFESTQSVDLTPPENAANNAFILNVVDPVFIPELGKELANGDIVFFDENKTPIRYIPKEFADDGAATIKGTWKPTFIGDAPIATLERLVDMGDGLDGVSFDDTSISAPQGIGLALSTPIPTSGKLGIWSKYDATNEVAYYMYSGFVTQAEMEGLDGQGPSLLLAMIYYEEETGLVYADFSDTNNPQFIADWDPAVDSVAVVFDSDNRTLSYYTNRDNQVPILSFDLAELDITTVPESATLSAMGGTVSGVKTFDIDGVQSVFGGESVIDLTPPENAANNAFILDVTNPVHIPELGKELESGDIVFFDRDNVPFRYISNNASDTTLIEWTPEIIQVDDYLKFDTFISSQLENITLLSSDDDTRVDYIEYTGDPDDGDPMVFCLSTIEDGIEINSEEKGFVFKFSIDEFPEYVGFSGNIDSFPPTNPNPSFLALYLTEYYDEDLQEMVVSGSIGDLFNGIMIGFDNIPDFNENDEWGLSVRSNSDSFVVLSFYHESDVNTPIVELVIDPSLADSPDNFVPINLDSVGGALMYAPSFIKLVESPENNFKFKLLGGSLGKIDESKLPETAAGNLLQLKLSAPAYYESIDKTLHNNDIIVFNLDGSPKFILNSSEEIDVSTLATKVDLNSEINILDLKSRIRPWTPERNPPVPTPIPFIWDRMFTGSGNYNDLSITGSYGTGFASGELWSREWYSETGCIKVEIPIINTGNFTFSITNKNDFNDNLLTLSLLPDGMGMAMAANITDRSGIVRASNSYIPTSDFTNYDTYLEIIVSDYGSYHHYSIRLIKINKTTGAEVGNIIYGNMYYYDSVYSGVMLTSIISTSSPVTINFDRNLQGSFANNPLSMLGEVPSDIINPESYPESRSGRLFVLKLYSSIGIYNNDDIVYFDPYSGDLKLLVSTLGTTSKVDVGDGPAQIRLNDSQDENIESKILDFMSFIIPEATDNSTVFFDKSRIHGTFDSPLSNFNIDMLDARVGMSSTIYSTQFPSTTISSDFELYNIGNSDFLLGFINIVKIDYVGTSNGKGRLEYVVCHQRV